MSEREKLAADCERYAKIIEGIIVVANDYKLGDPERREPRETLLKAAAMLRSPPIPDGRIAREALEKIAACNITPSTGASVSMAMRRLAMEALAALAPDQPVSGWQDIATAPRDGSWIIAICNDHSRLYRMSWGRARDGEMWWCTADSSYGEGLFNCGGGWIPCPASVYPLPPDQPVSKEGE